MSEENRIVEVEFLGPDHQVYRCVGIFLWEKDKITKIGFNARNDEVKDALEIPTRNILSLQDIPVKDIEEYQ